ncbi:hypothetical protein [Desulfosarcina cetonica]|uniref:hypothetical protein n=1 Tax=Desulfosarcina cetonica TaxID=90730 RepID=UPI0006CFC095|nr:hypothetical protein [Desulfosarcina cetonica]
MTTELKVGDWVTSYHQGIWQIYRILQYTEKDPLSGLPSPHTTIFSKRFVSSKFKRSFSQECCHPTFVEKLNPEILAKLETFIEQNAKLHRLFTEYKPKTIDSIYNARIGIPKGKTAEEIETLFPKERTFTIFEIEPFLRSLGFDTEELPSWTAQFVSKGHVCQDGYLVYKFHRIMEF